MGTVIINNGTDAREPIGYLFSAFGNMVPVMSRNPEDVNRAMQLAIGHYPIPPNLGPGGSLQIIYPEVATGTPSTPQIVYDQEGDARNSAEIELYKAKVTAWNAWAKEVAEQAKLIVSNL